MNEDVRWQQRLQNYQHAQAALGRGVAVGRKVMIRSRNLTSHTYNLDVATDIARQVRERFWPAFAVFETRMLGLSQRAGA